MATATKTCPGCGGQGGCPGSYFGDTGWHPCFKCGETGRVPEAYCEHEAAEPASVGVVQQDAGDDYIWHADGRHILWTCACGHQFFHWPPQRWRNQDCWD